MSVNVYGMPTGVQIPQATDFRQNQTASSRYRFRKILGEGSVAQAPFAQQLNSTVDVNYRFGAGYVINLAQTRLRISESVPAVAASGGYGTYTRAIPPIAAIRLQTSSGVVLLDIQNADAFFTAVYPLILKPEESDKWAKGANPVYGASGMTAGEAQFNMGSAESQSMPQGTNLVITPPAYGWGTAAGTGTPAGNGVASSVGGMMPGGPIVVPGNQNHITWTASTYTAVTPSPLVGNGYFVPQSSAYSYEAVMAGLPRQYICIPQRNTTITNSSGQVLTTSAAAYWQWDCPLSKLLPHTVCAALQDLYFGTDLLLTVSFQSMSKRTFRLTNPNADAQPDYNPANAGGSAFANGATLAAGGYYATDLLLATQDNLDLVNSVKQEIAGKGIRIPVQQPFMSLESLTVPSANAAAASDLAYSRVIRLNIARGAALLKSYVGIATTLAGSSSTPACTRLMNNSYISQTSTYSSSAVTNYTSTYQKFQQWNKYRMYLNAVPMSDSTLDPRDQWARSREWIRPNSFAKSCDAWLQLGGVCVEDFTSGFNLSLTTPEGGLPLANPIDIQCDMSISPTTLAAASVSATEHVFIGVMLKYLSISPAGVTLESV